MRWYEVNMMKMERRLDCVVACFFTPKKEVIHTSKFKHGANPPFPQNVIILCYQFRHLRPPIPQAYIYFFFTLGATLATSANNQIKTQQLHHPIPCSIYSLLAAYSFSFLLNFHFVLWFRHHKQLHQLLCQVYNSIHPLFCSSIN